MLFVDISAHISLHKGTWYEGYSIDFDPTCGKVARWVVTSKSWPPGHGDLCDLHSSFAGRTGRPRLVIPLPLKKMEQLNNTFCHFPTNSSNNTSHSASKCSSPVKVLSCPPAKGAQSFWPRIKMAMHLIPYKRLKFRHWSPDMRKAPFIGRAGRRRKYGNKTQGLSSRDVIQFNIGDSTRT